MPEPRPAASVLVMRDRPDAIELLFVRRSPGLKFMGGAWVFPGGSLSPEDGEADDDLAYRRAATRETLEEAGVTLADPTALVPFSRWITPEAASIRFDTRFYLAVAPDDAKPEPDRREVDRVEWWSPARALQLVESEEADLHFPTIKQIERLVVHETIAEAFEAARRAPVEPIMPRIAQSDVGFEILLPGDPGYEQAG